MSAYLRPDINAMSAYVPGEQPASRMVKLNTNESPFPPSPRVLAALAAFDAERLRLYSDPAARRLTDLLAEAEGVKPSQILAGNGSDELLAFAFYAFGAGGVSFPDITYGFYEVWAALYGLSARVVPLAEDFSLRAGDYAAPFGSLLVVANPNAPTGIALAPEELAALAASDRGRVLLVDEAYVDFGARSCVPLLGENPNMLIVKTFSKSRQLAGARLGYAVGSEALIADLNKVKFSFNPYNVGMLPQLVGAAALEDGAYFDACRAAVAAERENLSRALRARGFDMTDSKANFVFARHPRFSGAYLQGALREAAVLVRRFDRPRIADWLRITVGSPEDDAALLAALDGAVAAKS